MSLNPDDIGLRGGLKTPAQVLTQLVHDYRASGKPGPDQDLAVCAERLRAIQLAGATAAMIGGLQAMQQLFVEVQEVDPQAASSLDSLWDSVGQWLS